MLQSEISTLAAIYAFENGIHLALGCNMFQHLLHLQKTQGTFKTKRIQELL